MDRIIEKTMKNLEKNNISAFYAESREEVAGIIKSLVPAMFCFRKTAFWKFFRYQKADRCFPAAIMCFMTGVAWKARSCVHVMCGLLDVTRISALPMRSPKTANFIMWTAIPTALPALFTGQNRLLW